MNPSLEFLAGKEDAGERLDRFLGRRLDGISRSRIQAVIRSGGVLLNGGGAKPAAIIRPDDRITWREPEPAPCTSAAAEPIALEILHEDESLLVINKPAGMVVHPGAGHARGTLVSALLHHCGSLSRIGGVERPGIVHRLDKETSGCLVVAKTDAAHRFLSKQFSDRTVRKTYLAMVAGAPPARQGVVDACLARHPQNRKKMAVCAAGRGREAVTEYRVLESSSGKSLVECRPRTGRTHQVRVHLRHLGCPVLGDPLYGRRAGLDRHLLHAWKLEFRHPRHGRWLSCEAPLPGEFRIA